MKRIRKCGNFTCTIVILFIFLFMTRCASVDLAFCRGATPLGDDLFKFEWEKEGDTIFFRHSVPDEYKIDIQNETKYNISRK